MWVKPIFSSIMASVNCSRISSSTINILVFFSTQPRSIQVIPDCLNIIPDHLNSKLHRFTLLPNREIVSRSAESLLNLQVTGRWLWYSCVGSPSHRYPLYTPPYDPVERYRSLNGFFRPYALSQNVRASSELKKAGLSGWPHLCPQYQVRIRGQLQTWLPHLQYSLIRLHRCPQPGRTPDLREYLQKDL